MRGAPRVATMAAGKGQPSPSVEAKKPALRIDGRLKGTGRASSATGYPPSQEEAAGFAFGSGREGKEVIRRGWLKIESHG